jgi:hypothetical protein
MISFKKNIFILINRKTHKMNTLQKRFALFLFGCIPVRILFAYIASVASPFLLKTLAVVALLIALSFFYLFASGARKTGMETFGQPIWWNNLRPLHGVLYTLFAFEAFKGSRTAYMYLVLDVFIGLVSFIVFHMMNGDFQRVLS